MNSGGGSHDRRRSKTETEIPLYLIPHGVARQIRKRGDKMYRTSVKRTQGHHHYVTIDTKLLPKEYVKGRAGILASTPLSMINDGQDTSDDTRDGDQTGGAV